MSGVKAEKPLCGCKSLPPLLRYTGKATLNISFIRRSLGGGNEII